jgi:hypothetical protein
VAATTEHLVPRIKGGPSWLENEVAACRRCNGGRGHRPPGAWIDECTGRGWDPNVDAVVRALESLLVRSRHVAGSAERDRTSPRSCAACVRGRPRHRLAAMHCHSCGTDVREGQKFCMECGASLRGVADVTGEVPVIRAGAPAPDAATREMASVRTPPPLPPPDSDAATNDRTMPLALTAGPDAEPGTTPGGGIAARTRSDVRVVEASAPPIDVAADRTAELPVAQTTVHDAPPTGELQTAPPPVWQPQAAPPAARRVRFRWLLAFAILASAATAAGVLLTIIRITPPPDGIVPEYQVNDFGTNNTVAALLAAGALLIGALVWCTGHRWGAGLAGGAGASLAGWSALVLGAAEWRLDLAPAGADASRSIGYWALAAAGALGIIVLIGSLASSGRDGRSGLDPWIAALAAVSFVIAAGGPLIPQQSADWGANWTGDNPAGLPTMFFVGRLVQLGLLLVCGVLGCLLVRRWGLGLAVGGALAAGWLLATAATERTDSPIGPGYANPPFSVIEPHAVTVVGFALAGFFCLVAIVMALLDAGR